jgi:hypothetical protein
MRRADASAPANPFESNSGAGQDSVGELRAEWFAEVDVMQRMREVYTAANRGNASIYALDPRGLTAFEYGIGDNPTGSSAITMATDRRALQRTQDTLRVLAEETDGRAIVNRNSLAEGLAQIARDSSYYYLLGYTTTGTTDGKFHEIKVRVKRSGVQIRSRRGYWALSAADVTRATERRNKPELAKPIQQALATIAPSVRAGKYVQTWIGTERGSSGKTKVTFVWEPLPAVPGARREAPGRVTLLAASGSSLIYRGRSPEQAAAAPVGPQRIVFEAAPGNVELRITVEGMDGAGTLDQETRTIAVPDLTAPEAALGTPQVFRARNAREYQALLADSAGGVPNALREYSRSERLLIRFSAYGAGT